MDTTNSSENQQRRVEDRKPAEVINWAAPGAPAVPAEPAVGAITSDQIAAGAAVLCDHGKPIGRNAAIEVFDAMSNAGHAPAATLGDAPDLTARLLEMGDIIREGGRWNGNEFVYADKSESDISMLDDILTDALRLTRIERAAAPAPAAPFAWMKQDEIEALLKATDKATSYGEPVRQYGRIYARQYDADMVPVCAAVPVTASGDELPPLPPTVMLGQNNLGMIFGYKDRQMQDYARAALSAAKVPHADVESAWKEYAAARTPLMDTSANRTIFTAGFDAAAKVPAATDLPERDQSKPAEQQGLFRKFDVRRVDGSDQPGGKHHGCRYYVLDLTHDQHAPAAMRAYAAACRATHPQLAADIDAEFGASTVPAAGVRLVTRESAVTAIAHIEAHDRPERASEARAMLVPVAAAPVPPVAAQPVASTPVAQDQAKSKPTFMTDEQAEKWSWEQVKADVGTKGWTAGESCTYYGFFLWGWRYRTQYERQRAAAAAASTTGAAQTAEQVREPKRREVWSNNNEDFNFDTLCDLLDDGEYKPGDTVWVGDAVKPDLSELIDADDVADQMADRAGDIAGEHADGYPDLSKDGKRELDALLSGWIARRCPPNFYRVENVKPYVLSADDFPNDTTPVEAYGIPTPTHSSEAGDAS